MDERKRASLMAGCDLLSSPCNASARLHVSGKILTSGRACYNQTLAMFNSAFSNMIMAIIISSGMGLG
jgi:hypothetical protein